MTINPNNTTAACSGNELLPCPFCGGAPTKRGEFIECSDCSAQGPTDRETKTGWNMRAMVREAFRAGWYVNAIEAGDGEDQQPADYLAGCEEVDWLEYTKSLRTQASAPRSASAGDGMVSWQWLGGCLKEGDPDWVAEATEPTTSSLSLAVFTGGLTVWTARGKQSAKPRDWIIRADGEIYLLSEAAYAFLSAPPTIRIDQDVGIRALEKIDALISNGDRPTVNEQNAFEHFGKLNRLLLSIRDIARAAISANTTAGVELDELLKHWRRATDKLEHSFRTSGGFDTATSRRVANALENVRHRTDALASNPLEGKGIQSTTEQASSGLRSPTSGEDEGKLHDHI